jgi:hypothetical protein
VAKSDRSRDRDNREVRCLEKATGTSIRRDHVSTMAARRLGGKGEILMISATVKLEMGFSPAAARFATPEWLIRDCRAFR